MDIDHFWKLIAIARDMAGEDSDARVDALREQLSGLPPDQLQAFQNHYDELHSRAYRWDLWAAAFIINGGCSDDGFSYFRDWLVSEGRETFESALLDPESLSEIPRVELAENEQFGNVVRELFEEAGAGELDHSMFSQPAEPVGDSWDEDSMYEKYPRLAAKYD